MHLRESRTSKFSGLRQIYPPVTLKYPLVQKLIETPGCISLTLLFSECEAFNRPFLSSKNSHFENKAKFKTSFCVEMRRLGETQKQPIYKTSHYYGNHLFFLRQSKINALPGPLVQMWNSTVCIQDVMTLFSGQCSQFL